MEQPTRRRTNVTDPTRLTILKPSPTGDREMVTPPPAEGKTPIIRPGEIPQQPKQD